MPPAFSPNRFSLIDRGFVYAIAHVRGGTDCGYGWYLDGKMMSKRNSFLDFIAAARHLCREGFTAPGNIVIHGGSAGGMLVGAVANMQPELFRAVIAEVPFVDVLNTMSDGDLPLTPPEWVEWGNPVTDAEACRYMATYCPYTNVARQPYPHILATGGLMVIFGSCEAMIVSVLVGESWGSSRGPGSLTCCAGNVRRLRRAR